MEPVVDKSTASEAASAHARINVPLNLANWKDLPEDVQHLCMWFHQFILDNGLAWDEAAEALGYDRSTVYRVLHGTYGGSWPNIQKAIRAYQKLAETRGTIQRNQFVKTSVTEMIFAGLDYARANNSVTAIIGESRHGKTISALAWRDENNHGASVYVVAPPYGGAKMFLRRLADAVGVNKNLNIPQLYEAICRAFNPNRILLVDEAHRLLPSDTRSNPVNLEILRDMHDSTKCAMALIATQRLYDRMEASQYQFEQVLGRIGMPVYLPGEIRAKDFMPILEQYVRNPSKKLVDVCHKIANDRGRLGILVETLKVASRFASNSKQKMKDEHVLKAIALRRKMMGRRRR